MRLPRVNPVGQVELPDGFVARPRRYPRRVRWIAALVLIAFGAVGIVTTVVSLGRYCLTTDAADTRALPGGGPPGR